MVSGYKVVICLCIPLSLSLPSPETRVGQNKHPRNFQLANEGKRRRERKKKEEERLEILYLRIHRYCPTSVYLLLGNILFVFK